MVIVRLARGGSHNRPYFYIVVTDSHSRRDSHFIEKIGFYNPIAAENVESFRLAVERFDYWVKVGSQVSPTVKKLIKKHKPASKAA